MQKGRHPKMNYSFRDPTSLTRWTRVAIRVHLALAALGIVFGLLELGILFGLKERASVLTAAASEALDASDLRLGLLGIAQLIAWATTGFLVLRWIHRANWNARALGGTNMQFTPGWSIGWYFVPIANLWKPYQAMKEIWFASSDEIGHPSQSTPMILQLWWTTWILDNALGSFSTRMSLRASSVNALIDANLVSQIAAVAALASGIVLLSLISRLEEKQTDRLSRRESPVPPPSELGEQRV